VWGSSVWHECAAHANAMAARLARGAVAAGVELAWEPAANEVFALLSPEAIARLQAVSDFYDWEPRGDRTIARWVCSWDTTEEDVDRFVAAIPAAMEGCS